MGYQIYCGKGFDTQKAERFFKERRVSYQRVDVLKYGTASANWKALRRLSVWMRSAIGRARRTAKASSPTRKAEIQFWRG